MISHRLPPKSLLSSAVFIKRGAKVSCNVKEFFESILLQDTVIGQNLHLITRYSYFKRKVSYYKILLLISVSRYHLKDTKIKYCPSLFQTNISISATEKLELILLSSHGNIPLTRHLKTKYAYA